MDLAWILAPTAALTELFSGVPFSPSSRGGGYLNVEHGIAIGRSCAGVRFFAMACVLGIYSIRHRLGGPRKRWVALAGVCGGAYLIAILANASRIAGALLLLRVSGGWGGPAKSVWHQAEGIVVFASYLVLYALVIRFALKRSGQ